MEKKGYKHLEIKISEKNLKIIKKWMPPLIDFPRFMSLKKWIGSNPLFQKINEKLPAYVELSKNKKKTLESIELLDSNEIINPLDYDSKYGYNELSEIKCVLNYINQIQAGFPQPSESKLLYDHILNILTDLFSTTEIKTFVNFGVSYAHIDSILASKFSEINFFGIDRSILTKAFNESKFDHLRNLQFINNDIIHFLDKNKFEGGVFFHTRTLVWLPKALIKRLYKAVANAKFQYIVCVEQIGISRQTFQPYQFSEEDQPSVVYRGGMHIHNYPGLLKSSGFSIERSELVKTHHSHEDFHLVSITSKRNQ